MSRIRSEPRPVGYLKRIAPVALWFACIAAFAAVVTDFSRMLSAFVSNPAQLLDFSVAMLVIGFMFAALQDAWN